MKKVYCVKGKRHTANVPGSEIVVTTKKRNRKVLLVKCASCGNMKSAGFWPGN